MDLSRRSFALAGSAAFAAALSGRAWADAPAAVGRVQLVPSASGVRLMIGLDRPTSVNAFFLGGPDRFVVDIGWARWAAGAMDEAGAAQALVRGVRCGQRPDGSARLVADLAAPASLARQSRSARELSFDLTPAAPISAVPPPRQTPGRRDRARVIVVDAGHGGRDPGAIGRTGVREKDVVLDAALQLRAALEARGGYRVALTRDADHFVPLEDRVSFARAQNADLFISLHADSHANREAAGASVYTLSERGAARAQNMASAQNWDIDLGEAPREGVVGDILVDLVQRETTNRSAQFAETVIQGLGSVSPLLRNTHRSAGFFVLLAPDVPAVLIETGFLSNPTDERRLSDPRARERMAGAMSNAVDSYFASPQLYAARA